MTRKSVVLQALCASCGFAVAGEIPQDVKELVAKMTLDEKAAQYRDGATAVERLGVPSYDWWNEALHGVARAGLATVFPQSIGCAATFDEALELKIGRVIGTEARAKYNLFQRKGARRRYTGLTLWSPNVNMFRDPRWGRGQETYGEDPYLTGRMGCAFVRGVQGDDPERLLAAACAKHFCVHSGPEVGRRAMDAKVSRREMYEYYLPAFEMLVKEARVEGVMTAYNMVNGRSLAGTPDFMTDILRKEWGFDGYITSDAGSVPAVWSDQKLRPTREETIAECAKSGLDLIAGAGPKDDAAAAVRAGHLDEKVLDARLCELLRTRKRLGILLNGGKPTYAELGEKDVATPEGRALALRAAEESIVLVKNNGLLPLDRDRVAYVGVAGPLGLEESQLLGNYNGYARMMSTVTGGLCEVGGGGLHVTQVKGCPLFGKGAVQEGALGFQLEFSDVIVCAVGITPEFEGEEGDLEGGGSGDRVSLAVPKKQIEMMRFLKEKMKKPLVAVVFGGSPLDLKPITDVCDAVMLAWYPGEQGGLAVAKAIFGQVNPAGRLPFTIPASIDDLPDFTSYALEGRTYRYAVKKPAYPFGYGLSYTTFAYEGLRVERLRVEGKGAVVRVSCNVKNTGAREGDEVVQLYVKAPAGAGDHRLHHLEGFTRVSLKPGETKRVVFDLPEQAFQVYGEDGRRFTPKGASTVFVGGGQPGFVQTLSASVTFGGML